MLTCEAYMLEYSVIEGHKGCSVLTNFLRSFCKRTLSWLICDCTHLYHQANWIIFNDTVSDIFVIYKVNNNEASTIPCGNPLTTGLSLLINPYSHTCCVLSENSQTIYLNDQWCRNLLFYVIKLHGLRYQKLLYSHCKPYTDKVIYYTFMIIIFMLW